MKTTNLQEMTVDEIVDSLIEIEFKDEQGFPMIKETLTRMGISDTNNVQVNWDLQEACEHLEVLVSGYGNEKPAESTRDFLEYVDSNYEFPFVPTLYQSCHILQKKGRYYIVHFKELYGLDGKRALMDDEDYARRNTIAKKLESWGMCAILNPENCETPVLGRRQELTIISHAEREDWNLKAKYVMSSERQKKE